MITHLKVEFNNVTACKVNPMVMGTEIAALLQ